MAALFGDSSVLQHHDPVGGADGGQPVGDDEQGAAGRQRGQGVLDQRLGMRVGVGGGLVEHEDRRVGEQCPGDGEALRLAAGQGDGRAELGGVTIGKFDDPVVDAGGAGAPLDFLGCGLGAAEADVVGDARPEQPYVLEHEPDPAVQLGRGDVPQFGAAEGHRTGGDVVEAWQQRGQGGLARAGGADEGRDGAGLEVEVDIAEDLGAPVVGEGHAAQGDVVAVGEHGGGGLGQRGRVQQFGDAYGGGLTGPDLLDAGAHDAHGGGDRGTEQEEGDEFGAGDPVLRDEDRAQAGQEQQDDGRGDHQDGGGGGAQGGADPAGEEVGEALGRPDETLVCLAAAPEALEDGDTGGELHGGGGDPADRGAELRHLRRRARHGPAEEEHPQQERNQACQGQAPVDGEQVEKDEHGGGEHGDDVEQGVGEQGVQCAHVVLYGLLDLARAAVGESAERQPPDVLGEPAAQGKLEVVVGEVGECAGRRAAHQGGEARRARQCHQRPQGVAVGRTSCGEAFGDEGDGDERDHAGQCGDGLEADGEGEPPAYGLCESTERRRRDAGTARPIGLGGRAGRGSGGCDFT